MYECARVCMCVHVCLCVCACVCVCVCVCVLIYTNISIILLILRLLASSGENNAFFYNSDVTRNHIVLVTYADARVNRKGNAFFFSVGSVS